MNQEAMLALARISKLKREISQPMLHHGYVADQRRIAAGRAKRRAEVNNVGRAIQIVVRGLRTGRTVATT